MNRNRTQKQESKLTVTIKSCFVLVLMAFCIWHALFAIDRKAATVLGESPYADVHQGASSTASIIPTSNYLPSQLVKAQSATDQYLSSEE